VLANIEFLLLQQCQRTRHVHILWSMQSDRGSMSSLRPTTNLVMK
jgi:hypothetical protein